MSIEQLKKYFEELLYILNRGGQFLLDSHSLLMTESSAEFTLVNRNRFLSRVRDNFWVLSIIEFYKIYGGKNDDYRLHKLINLLKHNYSSSEWKTQITLQEIIELEALLNDNETVSRITKLHELRNQHYAHRQKNPNNNSHQIGFYAEDLNELYKLAILICNKLIEKLFKEESFSYKIDYSASEFLKQQIELIEFKGKYS